MSEGQVLESRFERSNVCNEGAGSTGHRNTARNLSVGVSKSKVLRGLSLSLRAMALSWR
jgi:hypothetical protein